MVPREELFGMAICPYAKKAVKNKSYTILSGNTKNVSFLIESVDLIKHQVTIIIIDDYLDYSIEDLKSKTAELNKEYKNKDFVILDNDPRDPFVLNGVTTTFMGGYLLLVQSLSDLNQKHKELSKTNYYSVWTETQLDEVVNWRES